MKPLATIENDPKSLLGVAWRKPQATHRHHVLDLQPEQMPYTDLIAVRPDGSREPVARYLPDARSRCGFPPGGWIPILRGVHVSHGGKVIAVPAVEFTVGTVLVLDPEIAEPGDVPGAGKDAT